MMTDELTVCTTCFSLLLPPPLEQSTTPTFGSSGECHRRSNRSMQRL
jgi:hypothetical protein